MTNYCPACESTCVEDFAFDEVLVVTCYTCKRTHEVKGNGVFREIGKHARPSRPSLWKRPNWGKVLRQLSNWMRKKNRAGRNKELD